MYRRKRKRRVWKTLLTCGLGVAAGVAVIPFFAGVNDRLVSYGKIRPLCDGINFQIPGFAESKQICVIIRKQYPDNFIISQAVSEITEAA